MVQLLGPEGCPNAMNLANIAGPALIFFYFPNLICKGEIKLEELLDMITGKPAGNCIAH
jgi:hypothetical protein